MAEVTAALVKELREITGLGMMECKKALVETSGDLKSAEDLLRVKSGAKANKAAGSVAAEGVIGAYLSDDGKCAALVEVNCETDFVAKNADFLGFAAALAQLVAKRNPADVAELSALGLEGGTVEAKRQALVQKIGRVSTPNALACSCTLSRVRRLNMGEKVEYRLFSQANTMGNRRMAARLIASQKTPSSVADSPKPATTTRGSFWCCNPKATPTEMATAPERIAPL